MLFPLYLDTLAPSSVVEFYKYSKLGNCGVYTEKCSVKLYKLMNKSNVI